MHYPSTPIALLLLSIPIYVLASRGGHGDPQNLGPPTTLTTTIAPPAPTAFRNSLNGTNTTSASTLTSPPSSAASDGAMTISVTNMYSVDLSLSYQSNFGAPTPIGNPQPGPFASGAATVVVFPSGWAGRIDVGLSTNGDNSKIEGSITGPPDIDVSYVDGYSVPITCSSLGTPVTGCNIELFDHGTCDTLPLEDGKVCRNAGHLIDNGPATAFFAPCAGAAYTFPNDNLANMGGLASNEVECCVGTGCPAPKRQLSLRKRHAKDLKA